MGTDGWSGDAGWVDLTLLAALLLSTVLGLFRGLLFELMALLGWLVAYFTAGWGAPLVAPHITIGVAGGALNHSVAFVASFVAALIVWGLLSRLISLLIRATPLTVPDRLLGGVFGLLRGLVLLLAATTVVSLTPAAQSKAWQASEAARWMTVTMQGVKPLLPDAVSRWLPA